MSGKNYNSEEVVRLRRSLRREHENRGDFTGWFESYYASAEGNEMLIPWARLHADRVLTRWLNLKNVNVSGKRALVVGCGLGDDAQEISRRGYDVTAFDISETAVQWCQKRFPKSDVNYLARDLFKLDEEWHGQWDFVYEGNTLQSLPAEIRAEAIEAIAPLPKKGGTLLVNCYGRREDEPAGDSSPWPIARKELFRIEERGLKLADFRELKIKSRDGGYKRRFRLEYLR